LFLQLAVCKRLACFSRNLLDSERQFLRAVRFTSRLILSLVRFHPLIAASNAAFGLLAAVYLAVICIFYGSFFAMLIENPSTKTRLG